MVLRVPWGHAFAPSPPAVPCAGFAPPLGPTASRPFPANLLSPHPSPPICSPCMRCSPAPSAAGLSHQNIAPHLHRRTHCPAQVLGSKSLMGRTMFRIAHAAESPGKSLARWLPLGTEDFNDLAESCVSTARFFPLCFFINITSQEFNVHGANRTHGTAGISLSGGIRDRIL